MDSEAQHLARRALRWRRPARHPTSGPERWPGLALLLAQWESPQRGRWGGGAVNSILTMLSFMCCEILTRVQGAIRTEGIDSRQRKDGNGSHRLSELVYRKCGKKA